jgi:TonB family protein
VVKQSHLAIRQAQVFRIFFPLVASSAACTDSVRVLNRVLIDATPTTEALAPPRPGDYVAIVRVNVAADGFPATAEVSKSAGPPAFDDAARRSALASRYWPAIAAGKPVPGTFDFAMRWQVSPVQRPRNINAEDRTTLRVFGPRLTPVAADCVTG